MNKVSYSGKYYVICPECGEEVDLQESNCCYWCDTPITEDIKRPKQSLDDIAQIYNGRKLVTCASCGDEYTISRARTAYAGQQCPACRVQYGSADNGETE